MKTEQAHKMARNQHLQFRDAPSYSSFMERVERLLQERLSEPNFNAEAFSKAIGMCRMQLHRRLKAHTGLSTSHFIKVRRLKAALSLLKTSDISISEIGYIVGFNDPSYFTRRFRETYHCTPSDYIKKLAS